MALTQDEMRLALACFWRRHRRIFTPLTSGEWDRFAGIGPAVRSNLVKQGLVSASNKNLGWVTVYEITEAGRILLGDAI